MMKKATLYKSSLLALLLGLSTGCITPYEPEGMEEMNNLLVVEGTILAPYGTRIKLSRTRPLTHVDDGSSSYHPDEDNSEKATVTIITDDEQTVATAVLVSDANVYEVKDSLAFLPGKKYAVHIRLSNKEYQSAFVEPQITPEIDEVNYLYKELQQLDIRVSTHDDRPGGAKYFRWKYEEDWEIRSQYYGPAIWEKGEVIYVNLENPLNRYYCWKKNTSINFLLGESEQMAGNQIKDHKLLTIPKLDDRMSYLYSILVRQYALDKEAFEYFRNLQKNIDETGGLFAPQPTEIKGNIKCLTNPEEIVIGYIPATTETTRRLYIKTYEMAGMDSEYDCRETENVSKEQLAQTYSKGMGIKSLIYLQGGGIAYECVPIRCVDCIARGGTKNKPYFWPNNHQ